MGQCGSDLSPRVTLVSVMKRGYGSVNGDLAHIR